MLAARMGELRVGPGTDDQTQIGRLINRNAVDRIADKVNRTLDAGAKALLGGVPVDGAGCFYPPTVLTSVPRESAVATEEVFGPVAPIIPVQDDEDALLWPMPRRWG